MSDSLSIAESILLAPADLQTGQAEALLNGKLTGQADYADIYFQHSRHEAWAKTVVRCERRSRRRAGAVVRIVQGDDRPPVMTSPCRPPAGQWCSPGPSPVRGAGPKRS